MECRDVKGLLSDYIDQVLDKQTEDLARGHLMSCKACSLELENMKAGISKIRALNQIKAPEDFLQKVKTRIQEKSEFERIVSKIFSTPKIRIPVEAVGVFVTVVLVVAVFRFINPEGKPAYYPQVNEQIISQPVKPVEYPAPRDLFKVKKPVPVVTTTENFNIQARRSDVLKNAPAQGLGIEKIATVEQDKKLLQKGGTWGSYSDGSIARTVEPVKESLADKKPEVLLTIDSAKVSLSESVAKIRAIIETLSGAVESVEIDGSGVKNIISVKIPTITYARFIRELSRIGTAQVGVFSVKLQEKYLFLKVEIAVSQ